MGFEGVLGGEAGFKQKDFDVWQLSVISIEKRL
jgi:hypothetical protein